MTSQTATRNSQTVGSQKSFMDCVVGAQGQGDKQVVDLNNYKGIYFEDDNEKF